jgi:hypothetical protein
MKIIIKIAESKGILDFFFYLDLSNDYPVYFLSFFFKMFELSVATLLSDFLDAELSTIDASEYS